MDITQTFYNSMASQYDKLFLDWNAATHEQAVILDRIFRANGIDSTASVLDCACGIGTQSIGLAALGYRMTASDISDAELSEAAKRAAENNVSIRFEHADFCALSDTFPETFDIIICMDNALPHMLSHDDFQSFSQRSPCWSPWQCASHRPLSPPQGRLGPSCKGKAGAELRPGRRQCPRAACSFLGRKPSSEASLGKARPGQSSLAPATLPDRASEQSWSSAVLEAHSAPAK